MTVFQIQRKQKEYKHFKGICLIKGLKGLIPVTISLSYVLLSRLFPLPLFLNPEILKFRFRTLNYSHRDYSLEQLIFAGCLFPTSITSSAIFSQPQSTHQDVCLNNTKQTQYRYARKSLCLSKSLLCPPLHSFMPQNTYLYELYH